MADGGYDVADYRAIDPTFGTLAEAEALIAEALELGIRTIVDVVPNHVSDRHPWFQAALAAGPGLARAGAVLVPPRPRARTATSPRPAGLEFKGGALDPDDEPGRHARRLVPPPVHGRAAGPQLGPPRRPARARGDPPLLVRPRRRRRPHRFRGAAGQGPGAARGPGRAAAGRPPDPRPRRAPRHLPRLAGRRRHVPGRARPGRRDLARGRRAVRPLPPAGRAPHRVQLRLHGPALGRREPAGVDRRDARGARARSARRRRGSFEPRRDAAGHALRPRRHLLRVRAQALRDAQRPRRSGAAGPAPRRCSPPPCPAPSTSTRATSSGSTRSTSRRDEIQDPMHARSGGIDPGRDGCRVPLPWSGDDPAVRVQPGRRGGRPWLTQPAHWAG